MSLAFAQVPRRSNRFGLANLRRPVWRRQAQTYFCFLLSAFCFAAARAADTNTVDLTGKRPFSLNQPPAWTWGGFNFATRATMGALYDDNIQASPIAPKADLKWELAPELYILGGDTVRDPYGYQSTRVMAARVNPSYLVTSEPDTWPGAFVFADYRAQENVYTRYSEFDGLDHHALVNGVYPLRRLALGLKGNVDVENQTTAAEGVVVNSVRYGTSVSGGYLLGGRSSIEATFAQATSTYDDPRLFGSREWSLETWLNYLKSDNLSLGVGAGGGWINVFQDSRFDQTYEHLLLRGIYRTSELTDVNATAGVDYRQFNNGAQPAFSPYVAIGGNWRISPQASVSAQAFYHNQPSISYGVNYSQAGLSLGGTQKIADNMDVSLSLVYYHINYSATGAQALTQLSGDYYGVNAAYGINFTRALRGNVYYQYYTIGYTTYSYARNQVGVQVVWGF